MFLVKNIREELIFMDIEDYDREEAEKTLLMKLQQAEGVAMDESTWMSLVELKKFVEV